MSCLIEIRDLSVGFTSSNGETLPILRNIDLDLNNGQTIGLVGESGSGKSTLALAMMGYLKPGLRILNGTARFRQHNTFGMSKRGLEEIRGGELALIPQNAGQSLTPSLRIGHQIAEALRLHSGLSASEHEKRIVELLALVRLPDPASLVTRYPHELSGGQQQRVAVAMALAGEPDALLLDEPTTGLDVTTQAHVLELLRDLARETGTAMVYVSHDLGAIARVCDRVLVMYAGEIVLAGSARQVLRRPRHPYAQGLLASIPRLNTGTLPLALEGRPPAPGGAGPGCAFVDRCGLASERCEQGRPAFEAVDDGQHVRCFHHAGLKGQTARTSARTSSAVIAGQYEAALKLHNLAISYTGVGVLDWLLRRQSEVVPTVDDITVAIRKGETLGLVGESGSGKSTILKTIAGLLPQRGGKIVTANGHELAPELDRRSPDDRRRIQLIFQNPDDSLNPRHTIADILAQPLKLYFGLAGGKLLARSLELLERVRLGPHYMQRLPAQLSGGEKQRVAVARAFAANPDLVLCDEVTSALDVSVQAAVLALLQELQRERATTYVFVSHDLAVVRALADRVAVLYQGRLCELGPAANLFALPSHPYTQALLGAVLEPDPDITPVLAVEDVVELSPPIRGCPFQRRCPKLIDQRCRDQMPPWRDLGDGHAVRCHLNLSASRKFD